MPATSRLGILRSRGQVAPVQITTASFSFCSWFTSTSTPTFALGTKVCGRLVTYRKERPEATYDALCSHQIKTALDHSLLEFHAANINWLGVQVEVESAYFGIPYIRSPPIRSFRSYTVTRCPALFSWSAQARPAGPEPMMAIFFPVRNEGGLGAIQPISKPWITYNEH